MKDISNTPERVQFALKQMKTVMPSVRKQVAIYERNIAFVKNQKKSFIDSGIQNQNS